MLSYCRPILGELGPVRNIFNFRFSRTLKNFIEYKYGTPERTYLENALHELVNTHIEVPIVIGNQAIYTGNEQCLRMPHNHQQIVAKFCYSNPQQIEIAVKEALKVQEMWRAVPAVERAAIWRKCADLIATENRYQLNAAIMLSQAKTYLEAEEDTYRLIETVRANADFLIQLDQIKLTNDTDDARRVFPSFHMRPLDGFVAAIGPSTMTWVSANLALCPALMGNCVLWKPSNHCVLPSYIIYKTMKEAGLPIGVINFLPANRKLFVEFITQSPHMAGVNFTGHIDNFRDIWQEVSKRLDSYNSVPRLVGECGGKNFHFLHESADFDVALDATVHAAFEFSGQKCTACSRVYVPKSMWPAFGCAINQEVCGLKIGDPCDFTAYTSAVISEDYFDRVLDYLNFAQRSSKVEVICGGDFCKTLGYFIEPTVLVCTDPHDRLMLDEIFGPVLCVYIYENEELDSTLELVANTSKYAYTGSIFASDDKVICNALKKLRMAAGNIYINEKCTGSLAGLIPFGGNRLSGTNDKPGSAYFLLRWSSPQLVEESFPLEPTDKTSQCQN